MRTRYENNAQKNINVNTYLWYSCSTGNTLQLQSHFTQPACSCLTNRNERTCARLAEGALLQSDNILWLLLELIQLIVFSPIRVWCGLVKQCQANWIKSLSFPGNEEEKGGTRSNATAFSFFLFFFESNLITVLSLNVTFTAALIKMWDVPTQTIHSLSNGL